jgi:glyoxalase family protein
MTHPILGLHHVTATVDDAQDDLDFCLGVLGLRLVKKTVNFDNHNVYHFYYGDELGTPGTIWTTFPYKGHGVRAGTKGAGQVVVTSFSVPAGSLEAWAERLARQGVGSRRLAPRFGDEVIALDDPSGLSFELVAGDRDPRQPWTGRLEAESAIRGLHSVTLEVRDSEPTVALMTEVLGYEVIETAGKRVRLAVGEEAPGHLIDVVAEADAEAAVNGIGTVHHVAMAIDNDEEQLRLREDLVSRGLMVTPVRDRSYFRSIYFREPGGVLFEVATMRPGFTRDEAPEELGRALRLPEWEEPHRAIIEAGLAPVTY